jgi:hypothetical protein
MERSTSATKYLTVGMIFVQLQVQFAERAA